MFNLQCLQFHFQSLTWWFPNNLPAGRQEFYLSKLVQVVELNTRKLLKQSKKNVHNLIIKCCKQNKQTINDRITYFT